MGAMIERTSLRVMMVSFTFAAYPSMGMDWLAGGAVWA